MSYPKKDWRAPSHQSFCGYDNDKDLRGRPLMILGEGQRKSRKKNFRGPSPGKFFLESPSPGKIFLRGLLEKKNYGRGSFILKISSSPPVINGRPLKTHFLVTWLIIARNMAICFFTISHLGQSFL